MATVRVTAEVVRRAAERIEKRYIRAASRAAGLKELSIMSKARFGYDGASDGFVSLTDDDVSFLRLSVSE